MQSPAFTNKIAPAYKLQSLVDSLASYGVSETQALAGTGLVKAQLHDSETRISMEQQTLVYRNAIRYADDPAFALRAGRCIQLTNYGQYGYALLSSETLRDALVFAVKYQPMVLRTVRMELQEEGDVAHFVLTDVLSVADVAHFNLEFQLGIILSIYRDILGEWFSFSEARISYPAPAHASVYERILECPVRFDCEANEFRFPRQLLDMNMPKGNAITRDLARQLCDEAMAQVDDASSIATRVHEKLMHSLGVFPTIVEMAEDFNFCARTLRRKLTAEGKSYQGLVDEVRQTLAINYLLHSQLTVEEVGERLGYGNNSNFRHAFKRWTGITPRQCRLGRAAAP